MHSPPSPHPYGLKPMSGRDAHEPPGHRHVAQLLVEAEAEAASTH